MREPGLAGAWLPPLLVARPPFYLRCAFQRAARPPASRFGLAEDLRPPVGRPPKICLICVASATPSSSLPATGWPCGAGDDIQWVVGGHERGVPGSGQRRDDGFADLHAVCFKFEAFLGVASRARMGVEARLDAYQGRRAPSASVGRVAVGGPRREALAWRRCARRVDAFCRPENEGIVGHEDAVLTGVATPIVVDPWRVPRVGNARGRVGWRRWRLWRRTAWGTGGGGGIPRGAGVRRGWMRRWPGATN